MGKQNKKSNCNLGLTGSDIIAEEAPLHPIFPLS